MTAVIPNPNGSAAVRLQTKGGGMYISGEESPKQLRMRAAWKRNGCDTASGRVGTKDIIVVVRFHPVQFVPG